MASYRKRSGGWRAEVAKQGVRDSQTFDTKAAAVAWATAREAEIIMQNGKSRTSVSMTLSEALRRYKRDVSPTKAGQRWEELRLDRFDRESINIFRVLCDTLDLLEQMASQIVSHVHGSSPPPTTAAAFAADAAKAAILSTELAVVTLSCSNLLHRKIQAAPHRSRLGLAVSGSC